MRRLGWLLVGCGLLAGCDNFLIGKQGLIRDRSQEYEKADAISRIEVPADLQAEPMRDLLVIPDIGTAAIRSEREFEVPRPDFFYAEAGNEKVNLARSAMGKQIVVDEPVEQVWKEMQAFWDYNEIAVAKVDRDTGTMETEWITDESTRPGFFSRMISTLTLSENEGPSRDKLRAIVKPVNAGKPGQTAIQLQHLRAPESQQSVDWSVEGEDVSYKSEIMYDLLHFLSKATEQTTARALAERQKGGIRSYLGRDANGIPVLKLTADVDQSWTMIEKALQAADIDVGSTDRDFGKYYITYSTTLNDQQPQGRGGILGFFDWLHADRGEIKLDTSFLTGDDDDANAVRYSSKAQATAEEVVEVAPEDQDGYKIWLGDKVIYVFGGDSTAQKRAEPEAGTVTYAGRYQVQLVRRSSGVYVTVLDESAENAPAPVAEDLLWNIKEHLPAG